MFFETQRKSSTHMDRIGHLQFVSILPQLTTDNKI